MLADEATFARWFDEMAGPLVLFARQWLGKGAAEDVVQEAFVRLLGLKARPANVKGWMFVAVRNGAIAEARSQGRREKRERRSAAAELFERRPGDVVDAAEAQEALEGLEEAPRQVIVMRIWGSVAFLQTFGEEA